MKQEDLKQARRERDWTQAEAAGRLGVSQPYLSLLESGKRHLPLALARRARRVYRLAPTVLLPVALSPERPLPDNQAVAEELAALGYPGFAYLRGRRRLKNPAEVLLVALKENDLEPRLTEGLPWLLLRFGEGMDQKWLVEQARVHNLQNRLGFVVSLARGVAEARPERSSLASTLGGLEKRLEESRLAREDTLSQASMLPARRQWLLENRSPEAAHWNLLTGWRPEQLRYVT